MPTVTRRDFLALSAATAVAAVTASSSPGLLAASATATGPNPFQRTGKPRLLLSLAAYSFRESFPTSRGRPNPNVRPGEVMDMFQFADYCAAHGCDGAEITSYFFAEETDDYMIKLRRHCFLRGIAVSGTAIGNNFSLPKGQQLDEQIAATKKWIDRALLLGAPHIRVFAGNVPRDAKDLSRAEADRHVISALEECADYAAKRGVFLGLENHDSIGNAPALLAMVKAVGSPWLGINLDSGNFRTADPYEDFAACVPYALNVQFKVEVHAEGGKKPADLKRFTRILRDGGYQGWVALEYEAKADPYEAVPRHLGEMKELFSA